MSMRSGETKAKAAAPRGPNAQVKTAGECCCGVFSLKPQFLSRKMRAFPFQWFVSFNNPGEIMTLQKLCRAIYSFWRRL